MAMIDYGVIAKKNGKLLTTEMFTPMIDTLGFECEQDDRGCSLEGNYFVYLGDKDFFVGIYKGTINIFKNTNKFVDRIGNIGEYAINWYETKFHYKRTVNGIIFDIKRLDNSNRYKLRFYYKNDLFEAIYGYGVDVDINQWYDLKSKDKIKVKEWMKSRI